MNLTESELAEMQEDLIAEDIAQKHGAFEDIENDDPNEEAVVEEATEAEDANPALTINRMFSDEDLLSAFGRHKYTDDTAAGARAVRRKFMELAFFLDIMLPKSRQKVLAITELEMAEAMAVKAIESRAPVVQE